MATFGEQEIALESYRVGRIRITHFTQSPAIYPRMSLGIGVMLVDMPAEPHAPPAIKSSYELLDVSGELRLSEHHDVVGRLYKSGAYRRIRSSPTPQEHQTELLCDLDHQRLEAIEERRKGLAPPFWVQLWLTIAGSVPGMHAQVSPFQLQLPLESWLDFYSKVGAGQFELIEVHYPAREASLFSRATARVRTAREKINEGEYDEAIGLCRKAIEALGHELQPAEGQDAIKQLLVRRLDEKRATEYFGVISKIKNLAAFAHHELGKPMTYTRAEAQFIVRTTESLLALVGRLATG
jgi:hypothetical protein